MKVRILAILLVMSTLFNVAGLIFFISFLNLQGHYKTVRRQRNQIAQSITAIRGAILLHNVMTDDHIIKRTFASLVDGQTDNYALVLPTFQPQTKKVLLMVYLHGMGSNYLEPFLYPEQDPIANVLTQSCPNSAFISCSYRGSASWGNDVALADITQNIREVSQEFPVDKIILIGTSMGGCTVLNYAAVAPLDIKNKIAGIVSVESAGDLTVLYKKSPVIRQAMILAFGGEPTQNVTAYRNRSFLDNILGLSKGVKVAVVSAKDDDIVPPDLQREIVDELNKRHQPVKLIQIDGGHGAPSASVYKEALEFVKG